MPWMDKGVLRSVRSRNQSSQCVECCAEVFCFGDKCIMARFLLFVALVGVCIAEQFHIGDNSDEKTEPLFWSTNLNNIPSGDSAWAVGALSRSLSKGAQMALEHCQEMFKYDRWNCPKAAFSRSGSRPANRETAFVLAITSAGVTHAVTRACSNGEFSDCTCQQIDSFLDDPKGGMPFGGNTQPSSTPTPPPPSRTLVTPASASVHRLLQRSAENNDVADFAVAVVAAAAAAKANASASVVNSVSNTMGNALGGPYGGVPNTQKFVWGGCSDHVAYGERIATKFLDSTLRKSNSPHAYLNLHNNRVGRLAVRDTMEKQCKCHGVSGSCTMKTCWKAVASFPKVAARLRESYDRAVRVGNIQYSGKGKSTIQSNVASGVRRRSDDPPVSMSKLVYMEDSPDYCQANSTTGWKGTRGRTCSRAKGPGVTKRERISCRELCRACGLRVKKKKREIQRNCQCTFQWCCSVHCKTCTESTGIPVVSGQLMVVSYVTSADQSGALFLMGAQHTDQK